MEAESKAMLNTLTEHDFYNAFKKLLLRGWWRSVGRKLILNPMAAPVPEIMDGFCNLYEYSSPSIIRMIK
jgi:hypothetical protein